MVSTQKRLNEGDQRFYDPWRSLGSVLLSSSTSPWKCIHWLYKQSYWASSWKSPNIFLKPTIPMMQLRKRNLLQVSKTVWSVNEKAWSPASRSVELALKRAWRDPCPQPDRRPSEEDLNLLHCSRGKSVLPVYQIRIRGFRLVTTGESDLGYVLGWRGFKDCSFPYSL